MARTLQPSPAANRLAGALETLAIVLLLGIVLARPFLAEMPYQASSLSATATNTADPSRMAADRCELSRVTFAIGLVAALACWALAGSARRWLTVRFGWLGGLMAAFAVVTFLSALCASDKRSALDSWLEQVSLMGAAFLAAQLFADRRLFVLLAVMLAAVGATLAAKAYWQFFVEVPDRIAEFLTYHDKHLQLAGITPGTPLAQAFQNRATERTAIGYGGLANVFASMLIVLAMSAIGLAAAKLTAARSARAQWKASRQAGEIHLPTVAAVVSICIAAGTFAAIFLTGSRAGIVIGLAAAIACGLACRFRVRLSRRPARSVAIVLAAIVLCLAGLVAYGIKYDRLPGKSMTFRWYYWTASAQIAWDHPLLGVGPGNFPTAYLQARRPAAEEAVKMPHNFLAHAFSEYGLPGGTLFIAIIIGLLIAMCRPGLPLLQQISPTVSKTGPPQAGEGARKSLLLLAVPLVSVPLCRLVFGQIAFEPVIFILLEVMLPTLTLAIMLTLWSWFGRLPMRYADVPPGFIRVAMGCGLAGFAMHNLTEFGFFAPGPAGLFWLAGGAMLAQAGGKARSITRWTSAITAGVVIAVLAAGVFLWWPVVVKTEALDDMTRQVRQGLYADAAASAVRAAQADTLDSAPAGDAARLTMQADKDEARRWAKEAVRRDPLNYANWRLAAEAGLYASWPDTYLYGWHAPAGKLDEQIRQTIQAIERHGETAAMLARLAGLEFAAGDYAKASDLLKQARTLDPLSAMLAMELGDTLWRSGQAEQARLAWRQGRAVAGNDHPYLADMARAVELDPQGIRLRVAYAVMLGRAGRPEECMTQLDKAVWLDSQLAKPSIQELTPAEIADIRTMQACAKCLMVSLPSASVPEGPP